MFFDLIQFDLIQESETRIAVVCRGGCRLRWATLELVETDLEGNKNWIVRRFDWFDLMPERDPSFQQAVSPDELRELLEILDKLNSIPIPVVDYATCCNDCACSHLRVHNTEQLHTHGNPFYCLHPHFKHEDKKVRQTDQPFSRRPDWCPLEEEPVLIKAKPAATTEENNVEQEAVCGSDRP